MVQCHSFSLDERQRDAWIQQIIILKEQLSQFTSGQILFEYSIPRMGKRVDVVFIHSGLVFVIEFKVNSEVYNKSDVDQCLDYALDLKNFHAESHRLPLIPILLSTNASDFENTFELVSSVKYMITVDTAIGHISGYLGKKSFLLLQHPSVFYWGFKSSSSTDYKNHHLLRQPKTGDWDSVINDLINLI